MNAKKEINKIVKWIKKEVNESGRSGCVVGVSGGIDSAVVLALCKLAFPESTYAIRIPDNNSIGGRPSIVKGKSILDGFDRAEKLIRSLNFNSEHDVHIRLPGLYFPEENKLAKGNYVARIRMAELYYQAEINKCLMIGTDNLCENYIGYFAKGRDGAYDINPLAMFYKSEVYELGKELGIPKEIMDVSPSADLWEGQTDEEEIGLSYDDIERSIKILEENSDDIDLGVKNVAKVWGMHMNTEHKRWPPRTYMREIDGL